MIDFQGQVAIVTGAGRGLGRLYSLELARRGAAVVVNDLGGTMGGDGSDTGIADAVVDEIVAEGGRATASHDSVATAAGGRAIVDTAIDHYGRVDAVVSNAGIFSSIPFEDLSTDDWRRMLAVHLDGAFHLGQPAFRAMKEQGYGRFVLIASAAGLFGQPDEAHYGAAKAGLVGLANVLALEGAPHGILANTVLPIGYSRMVSETLGHFDEPPETVPFLAAIKPELVVPAVVYLASRACTVTHQHVSVGAGRFARVFVGLAEGWLAATDEPPTAEAVREHLDEILATDRFKVPGSIFDEVFALCERLGI